MTEQDILKKVEKGPLSSKKFIFALFVAIACVALIGFGTLYNLDPWVLRILAGGLVVLGVGYVLGVAALERVLVRGAAIVRPSVDDHLDKVPMLPPAEAPPGAP